MYKSAYMVQIMEIKAIKEKRQTDINVQKLIKPETTATILQRGHPKLLEKKVVI